MKAPFFKPFIGIFAFLFSLSLFPTPLLEEDFERLKGKNLDLRVFGTICEEVAKIRLREDYPGPTFNVVSGISYHHKKRTLGELDLVVYSVSEEKAYLVGEVKCWRNLHKAIAKANKQLNRFFNSIDSNLPLTFKFGQDAPKLYKGFFLEAQKITFSNRGEGDELFDRTIGHSLEEVRALRKMLMNCVQQKLCKGHLRN